MFINYDYNYFYLIYHVNCHDHSLTGKHSYTGAVTPMWKKRITIFLKFKKCLEVITRERNSADRPEWDEQDLKAINIIYSSISNKQLEFVCEKTTAYGIINKLNEIYLKESTALQIVCRNKLEKLRLEKY